MASCISVCAISVASRLWGLLPGFAGAALELDYTRVSDFPGERGVSKATARAIADRKPRGRWRFVSLLSTLVYLVFTSVPPIAILGTQAVRFFADHTLNRVSVVHTCRVRRMLSLLGTLMLIGKAAPATRYFEVNPRIFSSSSAIAM
jgi:hypothetical protein